MRYAKWMIANGSVVLLAVVVATGCGVELDGEEGNLSFDYLDIEQATGPSDGDIAVGTKVNVEVKDAQVGAEGDEALEISDAYSDDAHTLDVADRGDYHFQLEAHDNSGAEGTRIHADAIDEEGEEVSDAVSIPTADVDAVELSSHCTDALYLTDSKGEFDYDMRDSLDNRLTGFGYYPVSVEPEEAGSVDESTTTLQMLRVDIGDEPGTYELVPDDDIGGEAFEFDVIEPEDVDELSVDTGHDDASDAIEEGETGLAAVVRAELGDDSVCLGEDAHPVQVSADGACEVETTSLAGLSFVQAEGLEPGECDVDVSLDGTDLEESFTVYVE